MTYLASYLPIVRASPIDRNAPAAKIAMRTILPSVERPLAVVCPAESEGPPPPASRQRRYGTRSSLGGRFLFEFKTDRHSFCSDAIARWCSTRTNHAAKRTRTPKYTTNQKPNTRETLNTAAYGVRELRTANGMPRATTNRMPREIRQPVSLESSYGCPLLVALLRRRAFILTEIVAVRVAPTAIDSVSTSANHKAARPVTMV